MPCARLAALGAALLLWASPHPAAAQTTFISTCPYTITQSGNYHVAQDLVCPGGGIVITANNSSFTWTVTR